jgi:hypothetical protein
LIYKLASEIPPNPPLLKGGQGGFLELPMALRNAHPFVYRSAVLCSLYHYCPKSENSVKKKTMNLTELTGNPEEALRNIFEKHSINLCGLYEINKSFVWLRLCRAVPSVGYY